MDGQAISFDELDGGTRVMDDVADLELCKELYELTGWDGTFWNYSRSSGSDFPFKLGHKGSVETREVKERYPAYSLGYLIRKLPDTTNIGVSGDLYTAYSNPVGLPTGDKWHDFVEVAKTPEDAACMLAIELFKAGVLKQGGKT